MHKQMLIGGRWQDAFGGGEIPVYNPANAELVGTVPRAGRQDVEAAIGAACAAADGWAGMSPFARGALLRAAADAVGRRRAEIAKSMTLEQGKPLKEALGEVRKGEDILRYYAEEGERVTGRIIPNAEGPFIESRVIYQPLGPVACISPWNYPVELLAWKAAAALAAGCTAIVKAPSETPLSPIGFVEAIAEAGLPPGVLNLVTGRGSEIGGFLTGSPQVKKVAFTGSTRNGKRIMAACAATLKRVSLELGGSLPMIVCDDADLEAAVRGAVRRSFRNMGQICIAVNRIYVQEGIYPAFMRALLAETNKLSIGNGLYEPCDLGPMCTSAGLETVKLHIRDAVEKGAVISCGGCAPKGERYRAGLFFQPTVLERVNPSMLVMQEETFGPVVGVMRFKAPEEAVAFANDSPYGLAAVAYTKSLALADLFAKGLCAGNVAINNVDAGVINAPYGGWKESGMGYEHGAEGLYGYLQAKHVRIKSR